MSFFDWWQSQIRVIPDSRIYFQESVELILSFFCFCFFKPIVFAFKQTRSMQTPIVFSIDNVFFVCLFCSSIFAFVWIFFLSNWVQNTAIVIGFRHSYTHRWGGISRIEVRLSYVCSWKMPQCKWPDDTRTISLSADDIEIKYSCNAIVWCSHFHVWCKPFVRYRIPKQSLLHFFGITSIDFTEIGKICTVLHTANQIISLDFVSMFFFWSWLLLKNRIYKCSFVFFLFEKRRFLSVYLLILHWIFYHTFRKYRCVLRARAADYNWMICWNWRLLHGWAINCSSLRRANLRRLNRCIKVKRRIHALGFMSVVFNRSTIR